MTDTGTTGAPHRPRLVRRCEGRLIAGVAAGIADHLGLDPLFVRLAFVVLAVGGGSGVLVYLAAWLLMPAGTTDPSLAGGRAGARREGEPDWVSI